MGNKLKLKIAVAVITYNQEKVISRALDSILNQLEYANFEIIVSDDCSSDGNWDILLKYSQKYPNIVKPFRQDRNLGIYANLEFALSKISECDIVFKCAGDDEYCEGFFKEIVSFIEVKKIATKSELFCIYSDWKSISPNGTKNIFSNHLISKIDINPISLKIRGLIFNRSVGFSFRILKMFKTVPKNQGISVSEGAFDIQLQILAEKNYYLPFIGSVYYRGIGVSSTMYNDIERYNYIISLKNDLKIPNLPKKDKYYLFYQIFRTKYTIEAKIKYFLLTWIYFILGFDHRYNYNFTNTVRDFFRMIVKRK
jgi:glycosyltransferase involved in cell wall biosynthesis